MKTRLEARTPNAVDLHVGGRVRIRRNILQLSQESLASTLGVTFQQVQKYERGANRISASKLYQIAQTLRVPVAYFFYGLPATTGDGDGDIGASRAEASLQILLTTSDGLALAEAFPRIAQGAVRRQVLDLVRTMVDATPDGAT